MAGAVPEFAGCQAGKLLEIPRKMAEVAEAALLGYRVKLDLGIPHEFLGLFKMRLKNQVLRRGAPELAEAES